MKKKNVFFLIVLIIVLIAVGIFVGVSLGNQTSQNQAGDKTSEYSAVYLSTGDIYFGKLDWFPFPRIEGPWHLERSSGSGQLSIVPLKLVAWGPISETMYLNPKEIVFWSRLMESSPVAKAIEAGPPATAPNAPQEQAPQPTGPTTPTK